MKIFHRVNRISFLEQIYTSHDGIETDVMYDSNMRLVLCHDHDQRDNPENDTFQDLIDFKAPLRIILDIKVAGVGDTPKAIANDIYIAIKGSKHIWDLCSFNRICVEKLLDVNNGIHKVGLITCGVDANLNADFISIDGEIVDADLIKEFKARGLKVYIWGIKKIPRLQADAYIISNSGRLGSSGLPNISQSIQTV